GGPPGYAAKASAARPSASSTAAVKRCHWPRVTSVPGEAAEGTGESCGCGAAVAGVGCGPEAAGVGCGPEVAGVGCGPEVAGVGCGPEVAGVGCRAGDGPRASSART